ncbi:Uncharacterized protein QTN25_009310 [Entamoeba marina]
MSYPIKLIVNGPGAVGKTCLLIRYTSGYFPDEYIPTVFDNYSANLVVGDILVNLGLWDTGGGEDYHRLRPLSYPQTDIFFLCFSVCCRSSFENVQEEFCVEIKEHCPGVPFILVGMKSDLRGLLDKNDPDNVTFEEAIVCAQKIGAETYVECSSVTGFNVSWLFKFAVNLVLQKHPTKKKEKACVVV